MDWLNKIFKGKNNSELAETNSDVFDIFNISEQQKQQNAARANAAIEEAEMQEIAEERENQEQAIEGKLVVIDGAKIKMGPHLGVFKVLNDVPTTQDKRTATIAEKQISNLVFTDGFQVLSIDGDWQNYGTYQVQDNEVLLKESKIQITGKMPGNSPTETGFVEFIDSGQLNVPEEIYLEGAPVPKSEELDFDIKLSIKKEKKNSTLVPFGILDFEGNYENPYFVFEYTLMLNDIDSLEFKILNENGDMLYSSVNLSEIVITTKGKDSSLETDLTDNKSNLFEKDDKIRDLKSVSGTYIVPSTDYTKVGSYVLFWDGFDNNEIYDSTNFNNKKLKAVIIATKENKKKKAELEFSTKYNEVDWVDVKIDKNNKRIDTTLRVNLTDGGERGLKCEMLPQIYAPTKAICPWDRIPKEAIENIGKDPIKTRTKTFEDLEKLALEGLNYHWGRNRNHAVAKDVKINKEPYEVYVNSVNTTENAMDDVELIYNTNNKWLRSGNPGSATLNPISWVGNAVSREAICYNVGYIKGSKKWRYREEINEDIEFKFTSAHEIGHEILKSYGCTVYSYGHKGSVNVVTQSMKKNAPEFPSSGEIDIMPYYPNDPQIPMYNRYTATEKDVLSLIWLTKIEIL